MTKHTKRTLIGLAIVLAVSSSYGCSKSSSSPTAPNITDTTPPTVSATTPRDGSTAMAPITVTFSEPMLVSTISAATFTVAGPGGSTIPGTVVYDAQTQTARFTPSIDLALGTTYTVTIASGVRDLAGNSMRSDVAWSFTTPAAPAPSENPQLPRSN